MRGSTNKQQYQGSPHANEASATLPMVLAETSTTGGTNLRTGQVL